MKNYKLKWLDATDVYSRTAVVSTTTEGAAYLLRSCRRLYGNESIGVDVFVSKIGPGRVRVQIQRADAETAVMDAARECTE